MTTAPTPRDPARIADDVRVERFLGRTILAISGAVAWAFWGWKGVLLAFAAGVGGRLLEGRTA